MSRKLAYILFVFVYLFSSTSCLYGNIVDNKYTTSGVGNLTPVRSNYYYLGSPTYLWAGGYFANLTANRVNLYNDNTYVSRDGAGNMIFTDAVSGTKTLAQLTVGSGGNVTGAGTLSYIPEWTSGSTLGDSPMSYSAGVFDMGGMAIGNVGLVDGVDVSTTVTGSGAPTRLAYFDGAQSIGDSNIYFDIPTGRYGIGTIIPTTTLDIVGNIHTTSDIDSDQDINAGNDVNVTNDIEVTSDADVGGALRVTGTANASQFRPNATTGTMPFVVMSTTNVTNLNADYLDGQHASAFVLTGTGVGNVTTSGMTATFVPLATSSTDLDDSILSGNSTVMNIDAIEGSELAPTIAAANWTVGAGWSIVGTTLVRVASAVTTTYPTVSLSPSITSRYVVTFTISGWTAGTMTMTLGGVVSTPLSGNQNVHLFVNPYTTGNLIFTPDANFAGTVSAVSVKVITGGLLMIEGDMYSYDSRGHMNRQGNMVRHLNEMATDTLLDKSRSELSCAGGVLTYTLYAVYGQGTWNFSGIVYPVAVASANVSLIGGTDAVPVTNYVYFYLNGNTPTLAAASTHPSTTHIDVAEFIVGAVSGSSYTIYGYNRYRSEVDTFIKRVIDRFENSGSLYESGSLPTVNATTISVASGGQWYQGVFEMTSGNTVVAPTSFFYVFNNGTYVQATSLSAMYWYADGTLLGSNERQNIVWGIVPTSTTASGTLPTTVKLVACLQSKPSSVYISATTAEQDLYEATNYYPPDAQLKEIFVPIARTILRPSTPTFETFGSGQYYRDLRGRVLYGGGAATTDSTIKYTVQVQAYPQVTTTDSQTLYWGSQQIAPSTTSNRWRVYIPKGGIIKTAYIYSYAGTAGSNENWSMYIRLNDTTDTLVQTLGAATNDRVWSSSALNIVVAAGDYIEIKEVQPAWGTNPGEVTRTGVVYIE